MPREWPEAEPKIHAVLEHLRARELNGPAQEWLTTIRTAYRGATVKGGLSGWMKLHNNKQVDTMQVSFSASNIMQKFWIPGHRRVAWNPFGVRFYTGPDWSDRRFNGVVTIASCEEAYLGYDRNMLQILVYREVTESPQKV